jgi:hypothetical protein
LDYLLVNQNDLVIFRQMPIHIYSVIIYKLIVGDPGIIAEVTDETDAKGGFIWEGVSPEQYQLFAATANISDSEREEFSFYSDKASYRAFISEGHSPAAMAKLFHDYHSPRYGLFLTGHWNRHHHARAREIEARLSMEGLTNDQAVDYLWQAQTKLLDEKNVNQLGSLLRRIDFALYHLAEASTLPVGMDVGGGAVAPMNERSFK